MSIIKTHFEPIRLWINLLFVIKLEKKNQNYNQIINKYSSREFIKHGWRRHTRNQIILKLEKSKEVFSCLVLSRFDIYSSHFLNSIPSGGLQSTFFAPMSCQFVLRTVPPDSSYDYIKSLKQINKKKRSLMLHTNDLFIAFLVSSFPFW